MTEYINQYKSELLNNVIPFWEANSIDVEAGGYYSCLNRDGSVFDTDKFIWLQARQVWTFSMLYNNVEARQSWLDISEHGAEFLIKHGRDTQGNWYFSLNREGQPLIQPYNIFSDCFAAMAFASLYKSTEKEEYANIAIQTFKNILKRKDNPKGKYTKQYPGVRDLINFSLPMILCNLSLEMEDLVEPSFVNEIIEKVLKEVTEVFYDEDTGFLYENVLPDGSLSDSFDGRLINPGHGIEAMWFVMDLARARGDQNLVEKALNIALSTLEHSWDKKYGGIFYFMDSKGYPPQQLEWDQKLWWVHLETLVCLAKGYEYTANPEAKRWFVKVQDYTWSHFKDHEYSEWFGYLKRNGEILLPLKGGKWKGCFHVPRALFLVWKSLESMGQTTTTENASDIKKINK